MEIYYTSKQYIESCESLDAKIIAIDKLIDAMLLNAIDDVANNGTASYSLDDGQMKISTQYRSAADVSAGIVWLEKLKYIYVNRRDGNITILRGKLNG